MVFKRTEYRREFRGPQWNQHFHHYKEKIDYRLQRKQREYHHEPFEWEDWEWENDSDRGMEKRPQSAPVYHREKRDDFLEERDDSSQGAPKGLSAGNYNMNNSVNEEKLEPATPEVVRQAKPKKPRPQTATGGCRRSAKSPKQVAPQIRPPFLAFGWADRERHTGAQRTHNVKAAVAHPLNIYPAALRAKKRQEIEMVRQQEALSQENLRRKRERALFNVPPSDTSQWLTEYRRNFSAKVSETGQQRKT